MLWQDVIQWAFHVAKGNVVVCLLFEPSDRTWHDGWGGSWNVVSHRQGTQIRASIVQGESTPVLHEWTPILNVFKEKDPNIKTLPVTDPALDEHIKRAHLQIMLWKVAYQTHPPIVSLKEFCWHVEADGVPKPSPGISAVVAPELMEVITCSCCSVLPCYRNSCSCMCAGLSCTTFVNLVLGINVIILYSKEHRWSRHGLWNWHRRSYIVNASDKTSWISIQTT